jgi:hypothetical protein
MAPETLSYTQSLRVIGQDLDDVDIHSFELEKRDNAYIVRLNRRQTAKALPWEKGILRRITEKILGPGEPASEISNTLYFTSSQILGSDTERRMRRSTPGAMPDINKLSLALRVLGDYLDRKAANDFVISWTTVSITVRYGRAEEIFTLPNLYDLSVHMYLKRSKWALEN